MDKEVFREDLACGFGRLVVVGAFAHLVKWSLMTDYQSGGCCTVSSVTFCVCAGDSVCVCVRVCVHQTFCLLLFLEYPVKELSRKADKLANYLWSRHAPCTDEQVSKVADQVHQQLLQKRGNTV